MIKSKALEINLASTQVDVAIDPQYACLQEVMSGYYGLLERLDGFLLEVSHPYKNWQFIVEGARSFALDYFHLFKAHERGPEAVRQLIDIFGQALAADSAEAVKIDAADNLILFLQKIVTGSDDHFQRFEEVVDYTLNHIRRQPDVIFDLFVRSYFSLKRLARDFYRIHRENEAGFESLNRLLIRSLRTTYDYWLSEKDPLQRFLAEAGPEAESYDFGKIFNPILHTTIRAQQEKLESAAENADLQPGQVLQRLLERIDHHNLVQAYRKIPQQLLDTGGRGGKGNRWKVIFEFQAMSIKGLAVNREDTLRDINRTLVWLITHQSNAYVYNLIEKTFSILKANAELYPATALACVENMGQGIYETGDMDLIDVFLDAVVELGFQSPMVSGVGNDWQIQFNSAHLQNIRTWLNLVRRLPKHSTRLISHLIIHLAISGVFIKDTDLFGRDVTRLLNSDIGPIYNLVKQLARLFPVYFNDIGAEGELRDISTRIDEICHRRDPLIHFLRKQSHVESSSRVIDLMDATLAFWADKETSVLAPYLPPSIFGQIEPKGRYVDGMHEIVHTLQNEGVQLPADLLTRTTSEIGALVESPENTAEVDHERMLLFTDLYKSLNTKYNLNFFNIRTFLKQMPPDAFPQMGRLQDALDESYLQDKIDKLLDYLEVLKELILSRESFEIREDIYKKRHITIDIPSMYGSYREQKFDAMGLTLRLEAIVNVLLEELIETIDLSLITKSTCYQISRRLKLFDKALQVDGIDSAELEHQLELLSQALEISGFSFTQFLDIFKGFSQAVRNIINDHFNNVHGENLTDILDDLPIAHIQEKYYPVNGNSLGSEKIRHRTSEIFLRDCLSMSLGLRQLDLFLSRILNTLFHQSRKLPREKLRKLLNYDPKRAMTSLHEPNHLAGGIINLGNKGLNMMRLFNFGLPVPPAFIITTEVFRCREIVESFPPAKDNFKDQVIQHIKALEIATGKRFGNPSNPLLLSVRSGSSISQPGMMATILNVGMNDSIAEGMAATSGNDWFAWDNYRRYIQCCGMVVGLERDDFDAIIKEFKVKMGIPLKREFSGRQMKEVAMAYKKRVQEHGLQLIEDPIQQLYWIIGCVMDSWESERAKSYRHIMGISDDWGTAVTIQAMVFGNISSHSGTGVVFTHNPRWSGDSLSLWGDFTLENQGEDVVSGLVTTMPISLKQQEIEMRETDITLETHFPEIYHRMQHITEKLVVDKGLSPQEIEFTFESPSPNHLYLLQTRDMAIREHRRVLTFDPVQETADIYLGHGIGVSGGAMSGRLVFTLEEMKHWRKTEPDGDLILVRGDTVPDDIKEIHAADGLLTARGGVSSHASVVAHRLGRTCVVGCGNMTCDEDRRIVEFSGRVLQSGTHISIDGRGGSVYQGLLKIKETK
jgi:pyruvate,orthophosphate dikinase